MRRRSFASEGRFAAGEPEGCASIREFGNSCDTRRAEMKFLCAFVPLCGKKKSENFANESVRQHTHAQPERTADLRFSLIPTCVFRSIFGIISAECA